MATRAADLLQEQVPGRGGPYRNTCRRPAFRHRRVERSADRHGARGVATWPPITAIDLSQTDVDQNVIVMRNAGVRILFIPADAAELCSCSGQGHEPPDFHPVLVLGDPTYSEERLPTPVDPPQSMVPISNSSSRFTSVNMPIRFPRRTPSSLGSRRSRPDSSPISSPSSDGCPVSGSTSTRFGPCSSEPGLRSSGAARDTRHRRESHRADKPCSENRGKRLLHHRSDR